MSIVRDLVQRADSWVNAMTGLGTLRDKLMHTQVAAGQKLEDSVLEALFNDDDIARRVVAKLPREATRRGFRLEIQEAEGAADEPDDAEPDRGAAAIDSQARKKEAANVERQMLVAFTKLEAMPRLRDGWIWARLYGGGSGVFVGADDGQDVAEPLDEARIRSVKFLNIVKRPQLSVERRYEDLQSAEYGKPELYKVHQAGGPFVSSQGLVVHESRLILFDGAMTAQMTNVSATGFDDSVLQSTFAPLQQTASAWQSVAHLMTDASQGVLKIANLVDLVASGGQETLRSRIQLMDLARSVCRAILVDAEKESFERVATSFAGLPEVMDKLMMRMGAAAEQPVTLLYGRSAAGLNATGESDIRGWYDTVAEAQSDELKPRLQRLLRLLFLAADSPTGGVEPEQWTIVFEPLWQPTDKEKADTKKVVADTYVALVGANIMTDVEAGLGLAPEFPTIDVESRLELDAADKAEGARPREVNTPAPPPGLAPGGEGGAAEGGGNSDAPKADGGVEPRTDSQPRVPAGSPEGGQWTSSSGAAGARAVSAQLEQRLVQRYGMPAKQAAIAWERELKTRMKARTGARAVARAEQRAAQHKTTDLVTRALTSMRKAVSDKDAAAKRAGDAAAAKKKAAAEKAKATRAANKAKKKAEEEAKAKAGGDWTKRGVHPDVDRHEDELKAEYGDAARPVAWGRAMHARGRAMPVDDYVKTMDKLNEQGFTGFNVHDRILVRDFTRKTKPANTGELVDQLTTASFGEWGGRDARILRDVGKQMESHLAIAAHRQALEKAGATHAPDGIKLKSVTVEHGYKPNTRYTTSSGEDMQLRDINAGIEGARKRMVALAHKDIKQPEGYDFVADGLDRANCGAKAMDIGEYRDSINTGAMKLRGVEGHTATMVHEMSHALEADNPKLLAKSIAFMRARTAGGTLEQLPDDKKGALYWKSPPGKKALPKEYFTRHYKNYKGKVYGTEILSMSAQDLAHGRSWHELVKADADVAHFALGQLANQ